MSGERYPLLWIGQVAVVTLPTEIDVTNADTVREDLLSVVNQGAVLLVADMSKTTFCDSAGVSALVRTFRRVLQFKRAAAGGEQAGGATSSLHYRGRSPARHLPQRRCLHGGSLRPIRPGYPAGRPADRKRYRQGGHGRRRHELT